MKSYKSLKCGHFETMIKAVEWYFVAVLFIKLNKVVLSFEISGERNPKMRPFKWELLNSFFLFILIFIFVKECVKFVLLESHQLKKCLFRQLVQISIIFAYFRLFNELKRNSYLSTI